jgi:hypothetical protein
MRIALYFAVVVALAGLAWVYPFPFELPLAAAVGGAYWAFSRAVLHSIGKLQGAIFI